MCTCGIIINLRALESHLKNLEILQKVIISNSISPNLTNCVVDNCGCYLLFPGLTIWNDEYFFFFFFYLCLLTWFLLCGVTLEQSFSLCSIEKFVAPTSVANARSCYTPDPYLGSWNCGLMKEREWLMTFSYLNCRHSKLLSNQNLSVLYLSNSWLLHLHEVTHQVGDVNLPVRTQ